MKYEIRYKLAFAAIFMTLEPGERITAEAGAMTSMDSRLTMKTQFSGGILAAFLRKFFGGESLFVNVFINKTEEPLTLVFSQSVIGDIERVALEGNAMCFQPGAYIAHTFGVKMSVR